MIKKLFLIIILVLCSQSYVFAGVDLPWSTTYDCDDWDEYIDTLSCDDLDKASSRTTVDGLYEQITVDANNLSGSGGKGQRHWKGDGVNNNSGGINVYFNDPPTEIWIRWYMRYELGFAWDVLAYDKILYFYSASNVAIPEFRTTEVNVFANGSNNQSTGTKGWSSVMGGATSDGLFHCYEVHMKADTNGSDGIAEWWIDGVQILDISDMDYGTPSGGWIHVNLGSNQSSPNNGMSMAVDFDDIAINETGYIGLLGTSDTTPPTITGFSVNGNTWTISADEIVTVGAGGSGGLVATMSASGTVTLTYSIGVGTSTLIYTGDKTVAYDETGTITYTQPTNGIEDAAGNDLVTITDEAVTNATIYPTQNLSDIVPKGFQTASEVEVSQHGTPTYDDMQDFINTSSSAGLISGGGFTDESDGDITVAAGTGRVKTTDSTLGITQFVDWAEVNNLTLDDNATSWLYYSLPADTILATTTKTDVTWTNMFLLGKAYREGTELHFVEAGMAVSDFQRKVLQRFAGGDGDIIRASGLQISEVGDLSIAMTEGKIFAGVTPKTMAAIDTTGADTVELYYNDGAWQSSPVSVIGSTQYNNYGAGLVNLSPNQYAVYWVYLHFDGELFVVYGRDSYTYAEAQDADKPAELPHIIDDFAMLIARVVIERNATTVFADVDTPWEATISSSTVTDHNGMASLQGGTVDEYYHATAAEYTILGNTSGTNSGDGKTALITLTGSQSLTAAQLTGSRIMLNQSATAAYTFGTSSTALALSQSATVFEFGTSAAASFDPANDDQITWYNGTRHEQVDGYKFQNLTPVVGDCFVLTPTSTGWSVRIVFGTDFEDGGP